MSCWRRGASGSRRLGTRAPDTPAPSAPGRRCQTPPGRPPRNTLLGRGAPPTQPGPQHERPADLRGDSPSARVRRPDRPATPQPTPGSGGRAGSWEAGRGVQGGRAPWPRGLPCLEHCQTTGTFLCAWYGPRGRQGWISPKGSSPTTSAKGRGHGDQDTGTLTGHSEAGPLALRERVPPSLRDSIQGENDHATCPHPHARTRTRPRRGHCGLARCRRLPRHSTSPWGEPCRCPH